MLADNNHLCDFTFCVIYILYTRRRCLANCTPQLKGLNVIERGKKSPYNMMCWASLQFAVLQELGYALYRIFTDVKFAQLMKNKVKWAQLYHVNIFEYRIYIPFASWLCE